MQPFPLEKKVTKQGISCLPGIYTGQFTPREVKVYWEGGYGGSCNNGAEPDTYLIIKKKNYFFSYIHD